VEKVTQKTGLKKLAEWIAGEDCKCDERRAKLNALFRYKKPNCLLEDEHTFLKEVFSKPLTQIDSQTAKRIIAINNRVFGERREFTTCGPCYKSILNDLKTVFNEY
jgi:hypothetical protein